MKKIIITCDTCGKEIGENHIMIGSNTETDFCFENNLFDLKIGGTRSINRYCDLHFCSKDHFVDYFFRKK